MINLSLGSNGPCDGSDALSTLCDEAVNRGVVMCVAAGNSGPGVSTVGSPGCARQVITVGATNDNDQITNFSSRGPTSDGRVKPDVCFPGFGIIAARAEGTSMGTPIDARYTSASGTSMATPHAAGVARCCFRPIPVLRRPRSSCGLMETAINLGLDPNTQGKGRGDAMAAHQYVLRRRRHRHRHHRRHRHLRHRHHRRHLHRRVDVRPLAEPGPEQRRAKNFWWILGILLVLCVCVTCFASALIAIALGNM